MLTPACLYLSFSVSNNWKQSLRAYTTNPRAVTVVTETWVREDTTVKDLVDLVKEVLTVCTSRGILFEVYVHATRDVHVTLYMFKKIDNIEAMTLALDLDLNQLTKKCEASFRWVGDEEYRRLLVEVLEKYGFKHVEKRVLSTRSE